MKSVLIYGAGCLGKNFLAPYFQGLGYSIYFCDIFVAPFATYETSVGGAKVKVKVSGFYPTSPDASKFNLVVTSVGALNYWTLAPLLWGARTCIVCENNDKAAEELRHLSGNPNIYFAIPDVIASPTASEDGELYVEEGNHKLPNSLPTSLLRERWLLKFFLHNTPHAVAAYLGKVHNMQYIHEVMLSHLGATVVGSMEEMKRMLIASKSVTNFGVGNYARRERRRFANTALKDPISRVARNPLLKISSGERFLEGIRKAEFYGITPINTYRGLAAACQSLDHHCTPMLQ